MGSNIELLKGLYAAFASGDVPTVMSAMDPTIEWREAEGVPYAATDGAWVGPEAIATNLFARLGAEWSPFTANPERYYDAGDAVVVEGRYGGKFNETGSDLDAQFCHIWKVSGGKLASFQQYTDTAQFLRVMNAVPAAGA